MRIHDQETMRIIINALQNDEIGLNDNMQAILARAPEPNDWAAFQNRIDPMNLVYLAAKTSDSFALLHCGETDILLHGLREDCNISGVLLELLSAKRLRVTAICRPGNFEPDLL